LSLLPKRPVRRRSDGRFDITLAEAEREVLSRYLEQLRDLLMGDDPLLRRLFPTAYPDDPDRDREYQKLMRGDLLEAHFAAIEAMDETLRADVIDEAQLTQWMQAINALRLVIGTRLDVSEDLPRVDPDDPEFGLYVLYENLGWLLGFIVVALSAGLPEPVADDDGPKSAG
jgi:Domain of unknown function (DUF2017)